MAFLIALSIVALYFWIYFSKSDEINKTLIVNLPAVVLAGITVLISFISYLWAPKKIIFPVSLLIYFLFASNTAILVISTGGVSSPFIALWMLVGLFAGIFGLWGLLPVFITACVFVAFQYINAKLTNSSIIITILSTLLPLIAGAIIWHEKSDKDDKKEDSNDKAYKNLANELNEVASKSEVVINAIGDGVVAIDNTGVIQLINPAAQSIIGWGKQDALALNYKSVLKLVNQKNEALDISSDPIQQALNTNQQIRTNKLTLMTSSEKQLMISLVASPVGESGSGVIVVFRDVTKEKAEEREQAEFISTASHEMRTPVASIEGYLGLALNPQTAQIDGRARDFILKAHDSAEHLGNLFQDLLDIAKSEDGRLSNNPTVVNVVTFIHDVVQGLRQKATEKGLRLIFKPLPDNTMEKYITPEYTVNQDNDHIREIINNLVENAIKYTQKGEIIVDVNGDEDHVTISVKDSGIGIPAEDMSHLFQKFYRVDDTNTRQIGGTGLGLYLCRRLAEIMGGRIWAESVYNNGSTFYLELPRISIQDAVRISEQKTFNDRVEAKKVFETPKPAIAIPPTQILQMDTTPEPVKKVIEPVLNTVPRGQALTPEQIAAYVAKQRALAQQQSKPQLTRPRVSARTNSISVPNRVTS
ncbi:MAG: ATP-binding protein [Candidatus Saccharibacteria bacterium]